MLVMNKLTYIIVVICIPCAGDGNGIRTCLKRKVLRVRVSPGAQNGRVAELVDALRLERSG